MKVAKLEARTIPNHLTSETETTCKPPDAVGLFPVHPYSSYSILHSPSYEPGACRGPSHLVDLISSISFLVPGVHWTRCSTSVLLESADASEEKWLQILTSRLSVLSLILTMKFSSLPISDTFKQTSYSTFSQLFNWFSVTGLISTTYAIIVGSTIFHKFKIQHFTFVFLFSKLWSPWEDKWSYWFWMASTQHRNWSTIQDY